MDRRDFFSSFTKSGLAKEKIFSPIYIPYIRDYFSLKTCVTCKKPCIDACEENIIIIGEKDFPVLDFSQNGCTFCKKCVLACKEFGVLESKIDPKINAKISIKTSNCLAWNQTMCFSCKDICEKKAINFFGAFRPVIDNDICNGCGICTGTCPVQAITVKPIDITKDKK